MNKIPLVILGLIAMIGISILTIQPSCNTTPSIPQLEQMNDQQFTQFKQWAYLTTKIASERLVSTNSVPASDLTLASTVLKTTVNSPIVEGATALLTTSLQKAGLKNDEITLALLIIETEIANHGGFQYVNTGGTLTVAPHTKDLVLTIAQALSDAIK